MTNIINIDVVSVVIAYIVLLILIFILRIRGIKREKELLIASIRMTLQLIGAGYILQYLLSSSNVIYSLSTIIVMEIFAVFNIFKRLKEEITQKLKMVITMSMILGTSIILSFFIFVVIRPNPWFKADYLIPIAGMIIGNTMTGITLGIKRLIDDVHVKKDQIELYLSLGSTPHLAIKSIVDKAFDASLLPSINSMMGMGIIFIPGMMTGQILAGVSPLTAIKYQIIIMLAIAGSVALTTLLSLTYGSKTYFNKNAQLVLGDKKNEVGK